MAVDKTQSATQQTFQPRLRPKPALPAGFKETLAGQLAQQPSEQPESVTVTVRVQLGTPGTEVRGAVFSQDGGAPGQEAMNAVRGTIDWPENSREKPAAAATSAQAVAQASAPASATSSFSPQDEAALLAWAEAVKTPSRARAASSSAKRSGKAGAAPSILPADPAVLAVTAQAQTGKPYAEGGETPKRGFDCSGLTSYVYSRSGIELPRNSREQFRHGLKVNRENLQKGDLVFFGKKGVSHVGIYVGDGEFLHAASAGGRVRRDSLDDPYWSGSFAGARRMVGSDAGLPPGMSSGSLAG